MVPPAGTAHPDHRAEQAYIELVHRADQERRERLERSAESAGDKVTAREMKRLAVQRLQQPVDQDALCFGRIDLEKDGKSWYLGRESIRGEQGLLVINWRVPAAEPFYTASKNDPHGLLLRRRFQTEHLRLLSIVDEPFGPKPAAPPAPAPVKPAPKPRAAPPTPPTPVAPPAPVPTPAAREPEPEPVVPEPVETEVSPPGQEIVDAILADMDRARGTEMRDIVATIEARQYELISDGIDGMLVIQGGPGSGKTAIALHRAAWLLFNHKEQLERTGVLVVGPNRAFMEYVAKVLPSLGETAVNQTAIDRLPDLDEVRVRATEAQDVAVLKGDPRMAAFVGRAVEARVRVPKDPTEVHVGRTRVVIQPEDLAKVVERARREGRSYLAGRDGFRRRMFELVREQMAAISTRLPRGTFESDLNVAVAGRDGIVDRIWPTLTAPEVLRDLLGSRQRIKAVAGAELTVEEQALLYRERGRLLRDEPWTAADMPLLDEADLAIRGLQRRYGYVLADEAQDLTPMQLRMVMRRATGGRATLVGDIAQSTGPWRFPDWTELVGAIDEPAAFVDLRIAELAISYRVPAQIMDLASSFLPRIAPNLTVPTAVRDGDEAPRFVQVVEASLLSSAAAEAVRRIEGERTVGVIVPVDRMDDARVAFNEAGVQAGDIRTDGLSRQITLLSSEEAKGLEFDHVVVVDPAGIAGPAGEWAFLYVALTRATRTLTLVHATRQPFELDPEPEVQDEPAGSGDSPDAVNHDEEAFTVAPSAPALGPRFSEALMQAKFIHSAQRRRGTNIPYFAHLQAVSALVLEDGGSEDEAIAALLHDSVEDYGGDVLERIAHQFGSQVAVIVAGCTDPAPEEDQTWRELKMIHLRDLESAGPLVRRIALAEKLDNARALVREYRRSGERLWERMEVDSEDLLWYFAALADLFTTERPGDMASELGDTVARLLDLASTPDAELAGATPTPEG
ncbi:DNA helicase [Paraconexibacter sp. AEG42_29]|uniref:DNA helicase n=1 Tax=Paraconexibacter sp. AEG42_29 TaxID=2997339 RepID=A0AAU7B1S1_9ACTN